MLRLSNWILIVALLLFAGCAQAANETAPTTTPQSATRQADGEISAAQIADVRRMLGCESADPLGPTLATFCSAIAAFEAGEPPSPTAAPVSYAGASAIVSAALREPAFEAGYLVLGGGVAKFGTVRPENPGESRDAFEIVRAVVMRAPIPQNGASQYARTRTGAVAQTSVVGRSLRWVHETIGYVRETPMGLVVMEFSGDGWFVGIFPR